MIYNLKHSVNNHENSTYRNTYIIVFFLLLAFSVPVSFSIISASLVTLIMFLTPHFGVFISAQKMVTGIDSFTYRNTYIIDLHRNLHSW